jgi:hypothetical protein
LLAIEKNKNKKGKKQQVSSKQSSKASRPRDVRSEDWKSISLERLHDWPATQEISQKI